MVPSPPGSSRPGHDGSPGPVDETSDPDALLVETAHVVAQSGSLESLSRPLLDLARRITGLESAYLSEVRPEQDDYEVLFADNANQLGVEEGLHVSWQDTLCRRAFEGDHPATSDASKTFPDSQIARELGIGGFLSVPVISSDNTLMGTLCSASARRTAIPTGAVEVMRMLAELLANQWERDRHLAVERRRAEEAEKHLRARATMLAEAEHKLKTPLTVIRGWSELMVQDWTELSERQRTEGFTVIHQSALDATRQVERLLEEARTEVLSTELRIQALDTLALVTDLGRQLQGVGGDTHPVRVEGSAPTLVLADREALWQALWHLAENALKYSPDGGAIAFDVSPAPGGAAEVVITVRDHGLGVPTDVDIFSPFVRGDHPLVGSIAGSGIGLHVVKTLITAMHGRVAAAPAAEGGSIFTITLPGLHPTR